MVYHLYMFQQCAQLAHIPLSIKPNLDHAGITQVAPVRQEFCLPDQWSLLIFHYHMEAQFDGSSYSIKPGYLALLPPGTYKIYDNREKKDLKHTVLHFRYDKLDLLNQKRTPIPFLIDLREKYASLNESLTETVLHFQNNPVRASVKLWNILYEIADFSKKPEMDGRSYKVIDEALRYIEQNIEKSICIGKLADHLGISHGYFCSLFRREKGISPYKYWNVRRLERAVHLLTHSTKSIKSIACETGFRDVQHFNKAINRAYSLSPSKLRNKNAGYIKKKPLKEL